MHPMPWYVAGPLIGIFVPVLLLIGGKQFGLSANLRHLCAMAPTRVSFFRYDWRNAGRWNLVFVVGIALGGLIAVGVLGANDGAVAISAGTAEALRDLGVRDFSGLMPSDFFSWEGLSSFPGFLMIAGGGFLVGFGARYAGGCTSGHAISGLAALQLPSLVAVVGFFVGGLFVTHVVLPWIL